MTRVFVDAVLHRDAQQRYRTALQTATSFVDHVSLLLMERDSITTAFALDPEFAANSVEVLPAARPTER